MTRTATRLAARWLLAKTKNLRVFDFDETLAVSRGVVQVTKADGEKVSLDMVTFAHYKPSPGDTLDFGEANHITHPRLIKKNWEAFKKDVADKGNVVVILTARPKGAVDPIKEFLAAKGIKNVDVVALQSSDPYDKARWFDRQIEEHGYEDVEFTDDSVRNANAVREHGEAHAKKGVRFVSTNVPHPKEEDFDGPPHKGVFKSKKPTEAITKYNPPADVPDAESKTPRTGPSDWWREQTDQFKHNYCTDHPGSKYCKSATEMKMGSDNHAAKAKIKARAAQSRNDKVKKYIPVFLHKIDQAGPAAGMWLDELEARFKTLEQDPSGYLKGFESSDFDDLFKVIFGYARK